jgi:hypothetical protein
MRPLTRSRSARKLETARRVVSQAEREALDRAEQLRTEAEVLFRGVSDRPREIERGAWRDPEDLAGLMNALKAEVDAARRRLTAAEAQLEEASRRAMETEARLRLANGRAVSAETELEQLRAAHRELARGVTRASRAGADFPARDPGREFNTGADAGGGYFTNFMSRMSEDMQQLVYTTDRALRGVWIEDDVQVATRGAEAVLADARRDADGLLEAVLGATERDAAAPEDVGREAGNDEEGAERLVAEARAEAETALARLARSNPTIRGLSGDEVPLRLTVARNQFARDLVAIRGLMDEMRRRLDLIIAVDGPLAAMESGLRNRTPV